MRTPEVGRLGDVIRTLRDWQHDSSPMQLHPGDLGWHWCFGAAATARAVRTWNRREEVLAIGFLDTPEVLRLTVAPEVWREEELAQRVVADVSAPERGVLPAGEVSVETPDGTRVQALFSEVGWRAGESWTPLIRDLAEPVERPRVRTAVVSSGQVSEFTAV